ncbi:hypothetical protein PAPYR_6504 [Paratrimastix pyriformis]|uniref:Centriolar satellite-associated tubulin polyglutamylase complex regulator 1 n=1 Tax=Paratrimastix pyriformis TaxID=342808 RepID=A0ABQ8UI17_9EUKA|nr:hypothetical protein PAPYR_6504 [Paratrimastix pyriformis]
MSKYISEHQLEFYFRDILNILLETRDEHPLPLITQYFQNVSAGTHVLLRPLSFVMGTLHNRRCFGRLFKQTFSTFAGRELAPFDLHQLTLMLCPDFFPELIDLNVSICWVDDLGQSESDFHSPDGRDPARVPWDAFANFLEEVLVYSEFLFDVRSRYRQLLVEHPHEAAPPESGLSLPTFRQCVDEVVAAFPGRYPPSCSTPERDRLEEIWSILASAAVRGRVTFQQFGETLCGHPPSSHLVGPTTPLLRDRPVPPHQDGRTSLVVRCLVKTENFEFKSQAPWRSWLFPRAARMMQPSPQPQPQAEGEDMVAQIKKMSLRSQQVMEQEIERLHRVIFEKDQMTASLRAAQTAEKQGLIQEYEGKLRECEKRITYLSESANTKGADHQRETGALREEVSRLNAEIQHAKQEAMTQMEALTKEREQMQAEVSAAREMLAEREQGWQQERELMQMNLDRTEKVNQDLQRCLSEGNADNQMKVLSLQRAAQAKQEMLKVENQALRGDIDRARKMLEERDRASTELQATLVESYKSLRQTLDEHDQSAQREVAALRQEEERLRQMLQERDRLANEEKAMLTYQIDVTQKACDHREALAREQLQEVATQVAAATKAWEAHEQFLLKEREASEASLKELLSESEKRIAGLEGDLHERTAQWERQARQHETQSKELQDGTVAKLDEADGLLQAWEQRDGALVAERQQLFDEITEFRTVAAKREAILTETLGSLRLSNSRLLAVIEQRERAYGDEVATLRARVASLQADCAARVQGLAATGTGVEEALARLQDVWRDANQPETGALKAEADRLLGQLLAMRSQADAAKAVATAEADRLRAALGEANTNLAALTNARDAADAASREQLKQITAAMEERLAAQAQAHEATRTLSAQLQLELDRERAAWTADRQHLVQEAAQTAALTQQKADLLGREAQELREQLTRATGRLEEASAQWASERELLTKRCTALAAQNDQLQRDLADLLALQADQQQQPVQRPYVSRFSWVSLPDLVILFPRSPPHGLFVVVGASGCESRVQKDQVDALTGQLAEAHATLEGIRDKHAIALQDAQDTHVRNTESWVTRVRVLEAQNNQQDQEMAMLQKQIEAEHQAHANACAVMEAELAVLRPLMKEREEWTAQNQQIIEGLLAKLDKAPDYGSGDCRFESCVARQIFLSDWLSRDLFDMFLTKRIACCVRGVFGAPQSDAERQVLHEELEHMAQRENQHQAAWEQSIQALADQRHELDQLRVSLSEEVARTQEFLKTQADLGTEIPALAADTAPVRQHPADAAGHPAGGDGTHGAGPGRHHGEPPPSHAHRQARVSIFVTAAPTIVSHAP